MKHAMDVATLEKAVLLAFAELRRQGVKEVATAGVDYYWWIPNDAAYDMDRTPDPSRLTVGQLSDDYREVARVVDEGADVHPQTFVWLAALLRHIGDHSGAW